MQKFRSLLLAFYLFLSCYFFPVSAQTNGLGFAFPLDRNPVVTGNYAELRPNHFHAGLDFSTDPVANLPIRCVADGYISRIKISSGGYGRVLYVTHPNGYVTVYAHQRKYAPKIAAYTRAQQIARQKNEIELFPLPGELPVKTGEVIGYTGNTGSSTGPHLHFEVRDEKSEIPLNPLLVYDLKDDVAPVITHLAFYNTTDSQAVSLQKILALKASTNSLGIPGNTVVLPQNTFALAFAGYDQMSGSTNRNNIYEAKVELDGRLIYHHRLDRIAFDQARFVNVFSEKSGAVKLQKCFTPSCYGVPIYQRAVNGGRVVLGDTAKHVIELTVADEKGNISSLVFYVKAQEISGYSKPSVSPNAFCNREFRLERPSFRLLVPAGALANHALIQSTASGKAVRPEGILVGSRQEKLLNSVTMDLYIGDALPGRENRLVMLVNGDAVAATYSKGWLSAGSKSLGQFGYAYDTLPPQVSYGYNKTKPKSIQGYKSLVFKVSDALSGIGDYHLYINDSWQVAEYDAKSSSITCYFDEETPAGSIHIRLEVFDRVGNKTKFEWKTER